MSLNQDLRTSSKSPNNPYGLSQYVKPGRVLTPSSGPPAATLGTAYDEYIDMTTGIEYIKDYATGQWVATIDYSSIPVVVPDPLVINELDVSTIKPDVANNHNIQITVPATSNFVNVGVTGHLTNLQLFGDGSVVSESATANHIIADGIGGQVTYGSSAITAVQALTITGNSGLDLLSNTGSVTVQTNNSDIDITSGGSADTIINAGGTFLVNSGITTITSTTGDLTLATTSTDININSANNLSLQVGGSSLIQLQLPNTIVISGNILDSESGNYTVGSLANSFVGMYATEGHFDSLGTNGAANISATASIIPSIANTVDLGSNALPWRNLYSNNALNIVSDERKKKNVEALVPGLDLIEQLCPVSFQFKDTDDERFKIGFIAQVTEVTMKEYDKYYDVVNYDKENDAYTMKYESLIGVLVKAVQELSKEVKELREQFYSFEVADQEVTDEVSDEV